MSTDLLPSEYRPLLERAQILLEEAQYQQALEIFEQIPPLAMTSDDWVNQAVCCIHLEDATAALQACDRALAQNSQHPQAWLFKGVALHRLGQHQEAYAAYDRALGKEPAAATAPQRSEPVYRHARSLKSFAKQIKNSHLLRLWVN